MTDRSNSGAGSLGSDDRDLADTNLSDTNLSGGMSGSGVGSTGSGLGSTDLGGSDFGTTTSTGDLGVSTGGDFGSVSSTGDIGSVTDVGGPTVGGTITGDTLGGATIGGAMTGDSMGGATTGGTMTGDTMGGGMRSSGTEYVATTTVETDVVGTTSGGTETGETSGGESSTGGGLGSVAMGALAGAAIGAAASAILGSGGGSSETSTVEKSIEVEAPVSAVYNQWTQFEEFPRFMQGVERVQQLDDKRLHWHADIGFKEKEWDAEIIDQVPDQHIAWSSTSGARNGGAVGFQSLGANRTLVTLTIDYDPEGLIENVGDTLGLVSRRIEGDLERFKAYIESRGAETGGWRGEIHSGQ